MKIKLLIAALVFGLMPITAAAQQQGPITLGSYETRYGDYGRYRGRAHNIRHASSIISTFTLQPGEQFSFNTRVGERTRDRGFRRAPVIISGRMQRDYGGGICQLASTLHAAAMYAGLHVVEHHPHSRISGYIRPGLDATVDWGTKDLVLENNFTFPVTFTVSTRPSGREAEEIVSVQVQSAWQHYAVRVRIFRRQMAGFDTIEEVDPRLAPGARRVDEPGTPRTYVSLRRTLTPLMGDEEPIRERRVLVYAESSRVILVGPSE